MIPSMTPMQARDFRQQLQHMREDALKDAEAFDGIIHVVERLGQFLDPKKSGLGQYKCAVTGVAVKSALAADVPSKSRNVHMPFSLLYDIVAKGRNDALHVGAFARHLTTHAIELALILENALRIIENPNMDTANVSDYMVREPVCAELWYPISFVRQRMLTNSFSYLPVKVPVKAANGESVTMQWCLVSDLQIAKYLQCSSNNERKRRLAKPLEKATQIQPLAASFVSSGMSIGDALNKFDSQSLPLLVISDTNGETKLDGILTAFDLL